MDSPSEAMTVDASQNAVEGAEPIPAILYSATGLDGSKEHTFNLSYIGSGSLGGPYVEVYFLE